MSYSKTPDAFDAAQGGALQPISGFHTELNQIQDEKIKQITGTASSGVPNETLVDTNADVRKARPAAEGGIDQILPAEAVNFKKIGLPRPVQETIYNNELKVGSSTNLATGDQLHVSKDAIKLSMPNGMGTLQFRDGAVNFFPGTDVPRQSTRDGVTTLTFNNGDTVKYNNDGVLAINRGNDSVEFQEKRPTPGDRLQNALERTVAGLDASERKTALRMADALISGDTRALSDIASAWHDNPEAMSRIVRSVNDALDLADIPRLRAHLKSSLDSDHGRHSTLSVTLRHNNSEKFPETTTISFTNSDNGKSYTSASYSNGWKAAVTLKPASVGMSIQNHIADPSSSLSPQKFQKVFPAR
jgi:hypothetical protein